VRRNLSVDALGDLLDQPLIAVLATRRTNGTVLLSPVWHEWRDGGFNVWVEEENVKARHLRRDPKEGAAYVDAANGTDVIVRIEPGHLRTWDFADEYSPR
jgi:Pyridoxamine 5'-phosphate oxidase